MGLENELWDHAEVSGRALQLYTWHCVSLNSLIGVTLAGSNRMRNNFIVESSKSIFSLNSPWDLPILFVSPSILWVCTIYATAAKPISLPPVYYTSRLLGNHRCRYCQTSWLHDRDLPTSDYAQRSSLRVSLRTFQFSFPAGGKAVSVHHPLSVISSYC